MRTVFQDGTVELQVQFTDGNLNPIDPDGAVLVSIFDPDFPPQNPDVTDLDATVLDATPTKVAGEVGLYTYSYTLAPDAKTGSWYDRWEATVDGVALETIFDFSVKEKMTIQSLDLGKNMVVVVKLDESIGNTSGETLGEDYEFFFSTPLDPMYASSDLLGVELGAWFPDIPKFTLDLNIHWASLAADANTFRRKVSVHPITGAPVYGSRSPNKQYFEYARTEYTLCKAGSTLLTNIMANLTKSKSLADLEVVYDNQITDVLSEMSQRCKDLRRVLNSGGVLNEGSSLMPQSTVKGSRDIDRPLFGRGWVRLQHHRGGANVKSPSVSGRRGYRHFTHDAILFKPWWNE